MTLAKVNIYFKKFKIVIFLKYMRFTVPENQKLFSDLKSTQVKAEVFE